LRAFSRNAWLLARYSEDSTVGGRDLLEDPSKTY
jgi:hypothetical protein